MRTIVWVIFLLIAAAIFRIFFLDLIEFKGDEASTVYDMQQFFDHPYLFQVGTRQSVGFFSPPLYNYLIAIISIPSRHPQSISFIIAILNTFSVAIFYLITRRYYPESIARLSSLLLALSPIAVLFSRKIWSTDVILPLVLPYFYFIHEVILKKNTKACFGLFLTFSLLIQLHPTGLFLMMATLITLLYQKVRVNWKKAAAGFLIGTIFALPFFYRQISSDPPCPDCILLLENQTASNLPFDLRHIILPFQAVNGLYHKNELGPDYRLFLLNYPIVNLTNTVMMITFFFPIFSAYFIYKKRKKYFFLVLITILLIPFYIITRTRFSMHYFMVVLPFIVLLYVLFLKFLTQKVKMVFLLIFSCLVISNLIFLASFYSFLGQKRLISGPYGNIFAVTEEFIEIQTKGYKNLFQYPQIRIYAYVFSQFPPFHQRMGEYFTSVGLLLQATSEFKKAISENPQRAK